MALFILIYVTTTLPGVLADQVCWACHLCARLLSSWENTVHGTAHLLRIPGIEQQQTSSLDMSYPLQLFSVALLSITTQLLQ